MATQSSASPSGIKKEKTVNPDMLLETLKRLEAANAPLRIEKIRVAVLKKAYEELAYPPVDVVGTSDWLEEKAHVGLKLSEVHNLLLYVKLFMPESHMHPKKAIDHLVEECSLRVPQLHEMLYWKSSLINGPNEEEVPIGFLPRMLSQRTRQPSKKERHDSLSDDSQLSKLFTYISSKWNYNRTKQKQDRIQFDSKKPSSIKEEEDNSVDLTTQSQLSVKKRRRTIGSAQVVPFRAMTRSSSQFSDIVSGDNGESGSFDAADSDEGNGQRNSDDCHLTSFGLSEKRASPYLSPIPKEKKKPGKPRRAST